MPIGLKEAKAALESVAQGQGGRHLATQQYEYAAELRERELQLEEKIKQLESKWQAEQEQEKPEVTEARTSPRW